MNPHKTPKNPTGTQPGCCVCLQASLLVPTLKAELWDAASPGLAQAAQGHTVATPGLLCTAAAHTGMDLRTRGALLHLQPGFTQALLIPKAMPNAQGH